MKTHGSSYLVQSSVKIHSKKQVSVYLSVKLELNCQTVLIMIVLPFNQKSCAWLTNKECYFAYIKNPVQGLPGSPVVKTAPPLHGGRGLGEWFSPDQGTKIPYAT